MFPACLELIFNLNWCSVRRCLQEIGHHRVLILTPILHWFYPGIWTWVHFPTWLFKKWKAAHQLGKYTTCQKHINHCNNDPILDSSVFTYLNPDANFFFFVYIVSVVVPSCGLKTSFHSKFQMSYIYFKHTLYTYV